MKRTMSMFAAVAALAVGFLFAAPAANAQNGTTQYFSQGGCTRAQSGNNSWPYSYGAYYCPGVTVAQHNGQRQVLFDLTAKAPALYNVLNTATAPVPGNRPGAQFYLMVDKTQYINIYNAQFGHNPPPAATPSDTAGGITAYNGNVPLYTVIFLKTECVNDFETI